MGRNGQIGSPLDGPYLLIAVRDDAPRLDRLGGARAPVEREPAKALA